MITDKLSMFGEGLSVITAGTVAAGYAAGDVMDIRDVRDIGNMNMLYFVASVTEDLVSATNGASIQVALISDAQNPPNPATATVHFVSGEVAEAAAVAGKRICAVALPMEDPAYERYVGIKLIVGGEVFTGGTIDAFLTPTVQNNRHYPEYDGV
jgi:hypothetical protein